MKTKCKTFGALAMEYISYTKETGGLKKIHSPFGPTNPHLSCLSLQTMIPKIRVDSECTALKLPAVQKKTLHGVRKKDTNTRLINRSRFVVSFLKNFSSQRIFF